MLMSEYTLRIEGSKSKQVLVLKCDVCNVEFERVYNVSIQRNQERHYCSSECHSEAMKSGGIADTSRKKVCQERYGSDYYITKHDVASSSGKLAHSPELEKRRWKKIHKQWEDDSTRKSRGLRLVSSKQENEFFKILEDHTGLSFKRQKYINGWFIDGWDPVSDTYIQFDGVYWHSQEHRRARDIEQNKWFKEAGITLIRVTDKEWKKDAQGILQYLGELLSHSSS